MDCGLPFSEMGYQLILDKEYLGEKKRIFRMTLDTKDKDRIKTWPFSKYLGFMSKINF